MSLMQQNLLDCSPWFRELESPYVRVAKLSVLNVRGPEELCNLLFRKPMTQSQAKPFHARSLLAGAWLRPSGFAHPFASSVATGALDNLSGRWAQWIASDECLRFCPACLEVGFQSVIHQIDGIRRCPLHRTELLSCCVSCGQRLQPYTLTPDGMGQPFRCWKCGSPISEACNIVGLLRCSKVPLDIKPFWLMSTWLRRLESARIDWPELALWRVHADKEVDAEERRAAVLAVLAELFPCPVEVGLERSVRAVISADAPDRFRRLLPAYDVLAIQELRAVYKSIRRQVAKRLEKLAAKAFACELDINQVEWNTFAPLLPAQGKHVAEHAWLLWRRRFEQSLHAFGTMTLKGAGPFRCDVRALTLRPEVLSWPVAWAARPTMWAQFAYQCFVADWETAKNWDEALRSLNAKIANAPVEEQAGMSTVEFRRLFAEWSPHLDPAARRWPKELSQFGWVDTSERCRALVLVAASASRAVKDTSPER